MKTKFSGKAFGLFRSILTILQLLSINVFAQDSYIVSLTNLTSRKVQIKAQLFPQNDTILMSPFGASHLENGWANFVTNLVAKNKLNNKINIQPIGGGAFVFSPYKKGEEINLVYTVNLTHEKGKWPFGYKEAAYTRENMAVCTGNALFISRLDMDSAVIKFVLPKKYKVTNAWKEIGSNTYSVHSPTELVWTVMAIGQYNISSISSGKTNIRLVYRARLSEAKKMLTSTISLAVKQYERIYKAAPVNLSSASNKFVCVINIDSNYIGGGAAFTNSISIMLHQPPSITHKAITTSWHHILIHEIGHLWNGQSLKSEEQHEWFVEGLTDYMAYKVEYELGLFNKAEWDNMLNQKKDEYNKSYKEISLEDAGNDKSQNYDLIYSGGLLFSQIIDMQIQNKTGDKKTITDLLQLLYSKFALTNKLYILTDIIGAFKNICNCDSSGLFEYVTTSKKMN